MNAFDRIAGQIPKFGQALLGLPSDIKAGAFDIHLKAEQPIAVCGSFGVRFLTGKGGVARDLTAGLPHVSRAELQEVFVKACEHSVFSHEHEISRGYIAMNFSCRAGVCGTAVTDNGHVKSVRDVSSIVFRVPREILGCADRLLARDEISGGVLIAGEPSSGKTTFLRDVVRSLSVGRFGRIYRTAVIDERGELGGFDLGPCADVLRGYPKQEGFDIAIRMLSPQVIVCDELAPTDLKTVEQAVFSGVPLVASVHACRRDFNRRPLCRELLETGAFDTVVFLSGRARPGEIELIERVSAANEAVGGAVGDFKRAVPGAAPRTGIEPKGRDAA